MPRWVTSVTVTFLIALVTVEIGCRDHCADLLSVAVSRDSKLVASVCGHYEVCVWDASTGKLVRKIETEKRWFSAVAYSPTADLLATGFDDGTVTLWEWRTGKTTVVLKNDIRNAWVLSESFSPNGEELAAAGMGWPIRVWNVKSGMLIRQLPDSAIPLHGGASLAYSLAFSPDGKTIAAGSKLWLRLWDAASGAVIRTYSGAAEVGSVAFSPNGEVIASSGEDGSITIWNASAGTQLRRLQASRKPLRAVAFSPDGRSLAACGWDGNIYLWDWPVGTAVRKISASWGAVNWVFFSADSADLISGGRDDNLIIIWQVSTGSRLRRMSCSSAVPF